MEPKNNKKKATETVKLSKVAQIECSKPVREVLLNEYWNLSELSKEATFNVLRSAAVSQI
jgi:hypothetical protein